MAMDRSTVVRDTAVRGGLVCDVGDFAVGLLLVALLGW